MITLGTVNVFCSSGEKVAFDVQGYLDGFLGTTASPAEAQNFNDYLFEITTAINDHANKSNANNIAMESDIKFSIPPGTVLTYAGQNVPAGYLGLQGQTFDEIAFPLLYAANGNSNVLPDMESKTFIGTTSAADPAKVVHLGEASNHFHSRVGVTVQNLVERFHSHPIKRVNEDTGTGTFETITMEAAGTTGAYYTNEDDPLSTHSHSLVGKLSRGGADMGEENIAEHRKVHYMVRAQ